MQRCKIAVMLRYCGVSVLQYSSVRVLWCRGTDQGAVCSGAEVLQCSSAARTGVII